MDNLKKQLGEIGYNEKQIESIVNKDKHIYFQDDVDNLMIKKESNIREKFERNYVSKSDYDMLKSDYNVLAKETKQNAIKEIYSKVGGKEGKVFDDFMKLNEDLYQVEKDKLEDAFRGRVNDYNWAFIQGADIQQQSSEEFNDKDIFKELGDEVNNPEYEGRSLYRKW